MITNPELPILPAPYAYVGNQVDRGLATLPVLTADPETSPNLHAFLQTYIGGLQELENTIRTLMGFLTIDGAQGVWLDYIGDLCGQPRGADNDDNIYRVKIRAAQRRNKSSGHREDIIGVMLALLAPYCTGVVVTPAYPAGLWIKLICPSGLPDALKPAALEFALATIADGVQLHGIPIVSDPTFAFAGGPIPSPPHGGYDVGKWVEILYP